MGVMEVFNKYMRQDGDGKSVAPTLVTYNLVRLFDTLFECGIAFCWPL